jgi:mannose-6-phosphate isomerase-like protein (cupin superfamily)
VDPSHPFATVGLADALTVTAPDGSEARILAGLPGASMAQFTLAPGGVSVPVRHRTVSELWYVVAGHGEMWRRQGDHEAVVPLGPGTSLSIPVGTDFQFRAAGEEPLEAVGVTMPAWPGSGEAEILPSGAWPPTVEAGPP